MQHPTLNWIYVLLWAGFIFVLSSIPDLPGASFFPHSDKVAHVLLYLPLGLLLSRAMAPRWRRVRYTGFWALAIGTIYGISDELHQHFVPGRCTDVADLLADMVGLGLGIAVFYLYRTRAPKSPATPVKNDTMSI